MFKDVTDNTVMYNTLNKVGFYSEMKPNRNVSTMKRKSKLLANEKWMNLYAKYLVEFVFGIRVWFVILSHKILIQFTYTK